MRPNVFWGKSESGRANSTGISPYDGDDVWGADQAESLSGRIVADWGGDRVSVFSQGEKDVDARLNWAGFWGLWSEVRYGLTSDGILLVVQGEDDLCGMLKVPGQGVDKEEVVPNEEHELE